MQNLQTKRRQSSIAGKVTDDATDLPVPGVLVTLEGPPAFEAILSALATQYGDAWDTLSSRPDRALTGDDGYFHFGDVPDGSYTLTLSFSDLGERYGTTTANATVTHAIDGTAEASLLEIAMPPTAVEGTVMRSFPDPTPAGPLQMARVRVRGTGQEAFTDENGHYYLTGVDPGDHTLTFSSPGLQGATGTVTITEGTITTQPTVTLNL